MARLSVDGKQLGAVMDALEQMKNLPNELLDQILQAGAKPLEDALRAEASKLNQKGHGTGALERSIAVRSPSGVAGKRHIDIEFAGKRRGGRSNAEVAFFNEYGSKNIHARGFVRKAIDKSATRVMAAELAVYDRFMQKG